MNPTTGTHSAPPPNTSLEKFDPEVVFDLIRPIEVIVEDLAPDLHGRDIRQAEARRQFILTVDRTLVAREPWSRVVPPNVREALVSRILRTYWWSQGGCWTGPAGLAGRWHEPKSGAAS